MKLKIKLKTVLQMETSKLDKEIKEFVEAWQNKRVMPNDAVVKMFELYNKKFKKKEHDTSCHLCIFRVYAKLKKV